MPTIFEICTFFQVVDLENSTIAEVDPAGGKSLNFVEVIR